MYFSKLGDFSYGGWDRYDDIEGNIDCPDIWGGYLGRGLYKFYASYNPPDPVQNLYFFLDTRDCNIPESYSSHDIYFSFMIDGNVYKWYYNPDTLTSGTEWFTINCGDTLKFSELKGVNYSRDCFQCQVENEFPQKMENEIPQFTENPQRDACGKNSPLLRFHT